MDQPVPASKPTSKLVWAALMIWAALLSVVVSVLMARHWLPKPPPDVHDLAWSNLLERTRDAQDRGKWLVLHFLRAECPCSRRIFHYLLKRGSQEGIRERVVFIGGEDHSKVLQEQGYQMDWVTPEELAMRYQVVAAPLLVVLSPECEVKYAGGYTARKQGLDIQDIKIISEIMGGQKVATLPVYGCFATEGVNFLDLLSEQK